MALNYLKQKSKISKKVIADIRQTLTDNIIEGIRHPHYKRTCDVQEKACAFDFLCVFLCEKLDTKKVIPSVGKAD